MRWTQFLIPTLREDPQEAEVVSHKLMVRAGFIRKLSAGAYSYLPLGFRTLNKVINIIREEMNRAGAQEVLMPALQPIELWQKTGRDKVLEEVMIKFRDRHGKIACLGPTHEEVVTNLLASNVSSYKDLPKTIYQIQTKFRDEARPRYGIIRSCEFIMKDAYSFDRDAAGLEISYKSMYEAYRNIFKRCSLPIVIVQADSGAMGGSESHEFMVPCDIGEDEVGICAACGFSASKDVLVKGVAETEVKNGMPCPKCKAPLEIKHTIEAGHTFKLGYKYSTPLEARFLDMDGVQKDIIMGCYGIGVNRILAALIETSNDKDGIIWPASISPFQVDVIPLNASVPGLSAVAEGIYKELISSGIDAIIDDREDRAGVKFKDADLIGFPYQVIVGEKNLAKGMVEIKDRKTKQVELVKKEEACQRLKLTICSE